MSFRRVTSWFILSVTIIVMIFVLAMAFVARDEVTRMTYLGMFAGSLLALPSVLDSLGLFGKKAEEYALLDKKLTDVYSPIHAMIVAVDKDMSRAGQIIGGFVPATSIDVARLSRIFRDHGHDLGNHNLQMWLAIEKEIVESDNPIPIPGLGVRTTPSFSMNKERRMWFDDLEAEYQRLLKELEKRR